LVSKGEKQSAYETKADGQPVAKNDANEPEGEGAGQEHGPA
jgi:hypothetical protein